MQRSVDTKDPDAILREVETAFTAMFPGENSGFVGRVFGWVLDGFRGRLHGYLPLDAGYHDLEHTLQGTLCLTRLLHGRHRAGAEPCLCGRDFELSMAAILLHDSGYLKTSNDVQGTGAKYTVTHVVRSAEFAAHLLADKGLGSAEVKAVQNMIRCTGVNANPAVIPFQTEIERVCGLSLATADLLGQMAAADYVDKLPILFSEFEEASRFTNDPGHFIASFKSASDLLERTPLFWREFVKPKLEKDFCGVYRFLNDPFPAGANVYLEKIEANLQRIASTR